MKPELKQRVCAANKMLPRYGLVLFTWGNVSELEDGIVAIKPSGVEYDALCPEDIVLTDLFGNILEGDLRPSTDIETHLMIYRSFQGVGGVTHTHSEWATVWAQAGRSIPALGTTHADYIHGEVPCTRDLTPEELGEEYERNTGRVIAELFSGQDAQAVPCALVKNHGPFAWGKDAAESVYHAAVLEQVAKMAFATSVLAGGSCAPMPQKLLDRHFLRKHGENAYYGQK